MTELEPSVVDKVLLALVESSGMAEEAYVRLTEQGIDLPAESLTEIKLAHPERYRQLDDQYGRKLETEIILRARQNALRATEIEATLMEDMLNAGEREKPQALRAIADVKAKSVDKVLALTGRPTDGKGGGEADMGQLLKALVDRGVFNVAPPEPKRVDAEAQVEAEVEVV
jgi:hypothetical protein